MDVLKWFDWVGVLTESFYRNYSKEGEKTINKLRHRNGGSHTRTAVIKSRIYFIYKL